MIKKVYHNWMTVFFILLLSHTVNAQNLSAGAIKKKLTLYTVLSETDPEKAIQVYTDLYKESEKIGYQEGMGFSQYKIAEAYDRLSATDMVIIHAEKAIEISRKTKDYNVLVNANVVVAFAEGSVSSYNITIKKLKNNLKYIEKIKDKDEHYIAKGELYFSIANIFLWDREVHVDSAIIYNKMCLPFYEKISNTAMRNRYLGSAYVALGEDYLYKNQLDLATKYIKKGLDLPKPKGYGHYDMYGYQALGEIYRIKKDYLASAKCYKKAISIAKEHKNNVNIKDLYFSLSNVYLDLNHNDSSQVSLALFRKIHDSLEDAERLRVDKPN